ncbi:TonB family protein [Treponema vincentii]|uniref:TonB family protein n=1 Tax=Treponema vincentii TaxID=69710 RepID=UPI0020A5881C|nr:TonB family protein [Treponema vincentii]UTC46586.1 TonB family protein [Treponema vincentii]
MIIRKTNGIASVAVFAAAAVLHFIVISAAFLHFSFDMPAPGQTQFVMQSPPLLAPAAPRAPQKQQVRKPAEKKQTPAPEKIATPQEIQEEQPEPAAETEAAELDSAAAASETAQEEFVAGTAGQGGLSVADARAIILQRIAAKKIYPKAARKHNQEGTVTLSVLVLGSGQLVRADIISPCPYKFLNEAALASVRAAAPFPLGDSAPEQIELTVTLEYRLEG